MNTQRTDTERGVGGSSGSGATSRDELEARLQATVAFMAREFRRNPRLAEIARVAHFSEYHFHRLFRRRFGKTPKQQLVEYQIEEVKRLMLAGQRPSDAARRAGFSHQSHLTSRFRQMLGMTPRQWILGAGGGKRGGAVGSDEPSAVVKKR
jgi:AraC-like DNA-binding protein